MIYKKTEITTVGIRRADHATPLYPLKLALTSTTIGGRSVGIVRSRTKATELVYIFLLHGLSPRANYIDRATAACRRSDCQLVRIEGATWSA
jgi:hypothetical protein